MSNHSAATRTTVAPRDARVQLVGYLMAVALTTVLVLLTLVADEITAQRIRVGLHAHWLCLPFVYHNTASTSDLVQQASSDVNTVRRTSGTEPYIDAGESVGPLPQHPPIVSVPSANLCLMRSDTGSGRKDDDGGRIVESGTHSELLAANGRY